MHGIGYQCGHEVIQIMEQKVIIVHLLYEKNENCDDEII
jgi:hypothetical protein